MYYSEVFKKEIVKKLLLRNNTGIGELSREIGVDRKTILNWRNKYNNDIVKSIEENNAEKLTPENWPFEYKYSLMIESFQFTDEEIGLWLREKGVKSEHIEKWKDDFKTMAKQKDNNDELRKAKSRIKELERELKLKEKALAETSTLLILKKKYSLIWEDEEEK
jgi:hypothetical protein